MRSCALDESSPIIGRVKLKRLLEFLFDLIQCRCCNPGVDCDNYFISNQSESFMQNFTRLPEKADQAEGRCQRIETNQTLGVHTTKEIPVACSRWVYDRSQYKTSIVSKVRQKMQNKTHYAHCYLSTGVVGLKRCQLS